MAYVARFTQTDFDDEGFVVGKTPEGQGVMLPQSARWLTGDALEVYADLMKGGLQLLAIEEDVVQLVAQARELGVSWALIGNSLGITGEGARKRYGDE